jgi:hypothetical protein
VKTSRIDIILVEGMEVSMCVGETCCPHDVFRVEYDIEGLSSETFAFHLCPYEYFGLCKFQLDFMAEDENITLFLNIDVQRLSIIENTNTTSLSVYPNPAPANSTISVSYSLDNNETHNLVIRNLLGAEVMVLPLNPYENKVSVDISTLKQGAYFYAIENKNQMVIAKKLIVK